jgi:hypothetical protein
MIRVLVMIAVTGFLMSVVTLSTAVAIGGPDVISEVARNGWGGHWSGHNRWSWDDGDSDYGHGRDRGPQGTRELAWTGGETLEVDVPAEITYTQAPGAGKLTVTGPQREIEDLVLESGHLSFTHGRHRRHGDLTIVMTAPAVSRFNLNGSGRLAIQDYRQDKLSIDVSGDTEISAKGEAKGLSLSMSGSGQTDFSDLKLGDADVDIDGSGQATLAPTGVANINISGSGDVTLLTRPSKLETNVSGSGSIHQKDGAAVAPTPPAPPEPPVAPAKPRRGRT